MFRQVAVCGSPDIDGSKLIRFAFWNSEARASYDSISSCGGEEEASALVHVFKTPDQFLPKGSASLIG